MSQTETSTGTNGPFRESFGTGSAFSAFGGFVDCARLCRAANQEVRWGTEVPCGAYRPCGPPRATLRPQTSASDWLLRCRRRSGLGKLKTELAPPPVLPPSARLRRLSAAAFTGSPLLHVRKALGQGAAYQGREPLGRRRGATPGRVFHYRWDHFRPPAGLARCPDLQSACVTLGTADLALLAQLIDSRPLD